MVLLYLDVLIWFIPVPTEEMYQYAMRATLGDDVYFEPSTAALEEHMAKVTGKEAGLFVPSGTASNQIAIRTHLQQPPYSVICDHRAHIHKYESGGAAFHSGAAVIPVVPSNGHHLTLEDIEDNIIITNDIHFAPTQLVELENTLDGTIFPQDEIIRISDYAHSLGIKVHLDGARLWHVAAETSTLLKDLCAPFDSVSLCFSKGLGTPVCPQKFASNFFLLRSLLIGAPVGSILVGTKAFITKARWFRRLFGGGMRQTGILAGCAAYALAHNFPQLPRVHALAKRLQTGLEELGVRIITRTETCMVCAFSIFQWVVCITTLNFQLFYDPSTVGVTFEEIADRASKLPEPLIISPYSGSRLVVHIQTSESAVNDFLTIVRQLVEEQKKRGFVRVEGQAMEIVNSYPRAEPKAN
ncbi:pyridoxal phosphate-dependent transferase [Panaeolus papilionaceus]|nr:pyridoxal phosphate-dependent transferase [Panaeolus papilionaceus]